MKEIKLPAKAENLPRINAFLKELGVGEVNAVMVSAEEIFINIASYAYKAEGDVLLCAEIQNGFLVMEFLDEGVAYNPLLAETPDVDLSSEKRTPGGLGIHIVRQMMDEVTYERRGNTNVLRLKKKLA